MNIKRRGQRHVFYRSRWVPRSQGSTHGYSVQDYVGSMPLDAEEVPEQLAPQLAPTELQEVLRRCCAPARAARIAREDAAQIRAADPSWRLAEATRLLGEVAELTAASGRHLHPLQLRAVSDAWTRLQAGVARPTGASPTVDVPAGQRVARGPGALEAALTAVEHAVRVVQEGGVGTAPDSGVRTTRVYLLWSRIAESVSGSSSSSLQSALQSRGWVKRRGR